MRPQPRAVGCFTATPREHSLPLGAGMSLKSPLSTDSQQCPGLVDSACHFLYSHRASFGVTATLGPLSSRSAGLTGRLTLEAPRSPSSPLSSLSFQTWLRSYIKLFQAPCQRCGKFLQDGLPPTWRDFRTLEAFHDTCRQ